MLHIALPALLTEVLRVLVPFPVRLAAKVAAAAGERTAVQPVSSIGTFAPTTAICVAVRLAVTTAAAVSVGREFRSAQVPQLTS